ncbi:MAG TPA: hypothetical protein VIC08_11585 [Cellvibrionaceae bacterium]
MTLTNLVLAADPHAPVHSGDHDHTLEAHVDTHTPTGDAEEPHHDCCASHTHVLSLPSSPAIVHAPEQQGWERIQSTLPQQQGPPPLLPPPIPLLSD